MDASSKKLICCDGQLQGCASAIYATGNSLYTLSLMANKIDEDARTELNALLASSVEYMKNLNTQLEDLAGRTFVID